jgi:hypothetical protein
VKAMMPFIRLHRRLFMIAVCACVVPACRLGNDIYTKPAADFAPPSGDQIREWLGTDSAIVCGDDLNNGILLLSLGGQRRLPLLYLKTVSIYCALIVPGSQTQVLVFGREKSSDTCGYWLYSLEGSMQGNFITECDRSSWPSLSPDGQSVAWLGARREDARTAPGGVGSDKTSLHIGRLRDFISLRCYSGDFDIKGQGPVWVGPSNGPYKLLVGLTSGEIGLFDPRNQELSIVCAGRFAAVIPGTEDFVFIRDEQLIVRSGAIERQVAKIEKMAVSHRSLQISPDGRTAVCRDWVRCPIGFGFMYKVPGLVAVDLETGSKRDLKLGANRGPWQFLDGRQWLSQPGPCGE